MWVLFLFEGVENPHGYTSPDSSKKMKSSLFVQLEYLGVGLLSISLPSMSFGKCMLRRAVSSIHQYKHLLSSILPILCV